MKNAQEQNHKAVPNSKGEDPSLLILFSFMQATFEKSTDLQTTYLMYLCLQLDALKVGRSYIMMIPLISHIRGHT